MQRLMIKLLRMPNDTDRLSSVRLHKNWRSLKLLWRYESSSSSMKEVEKAQRLLNQESSTTFTSRKLKDLWHFPLMTAVWHIQLQNGKNLLLLLEWGGESSKTIESSKLKDLWLLLTPTAVWQIQLQTDIIFFPNEVENRLQIASRKKTIESSKLKDLWLLLTPTAVWQIQLQIGIIFFRNEVENRLQIASRKHFGGSSHK
jgi:hypothetical protein